MDPYSLDWIQKYGLSILIGAAFAVLLLQNTPFVAIISIIFMYFWIYGIHRILHILPREGVFEYLNTHWNLHHQPLKLLDRRIELFIEIVNDLGMHGVLFLIQWVLGISIIPTSIIVFHAIWYTSVHWINYSIIGSRTHKDHHKNMDTNFGPDVLDHLFGSNHDETKEDLLLLIPNAILAFFATAGLKQVFQWQD